MELGDFPEGEFQLSVHGLSGNVFVDRTIQVLSGHVEMVDIAHLPVGNHFFQLTDESGRLFASGKFVKN